MANDNQTIIIKKVNKGHHGHHGGAWKVAYADFVTAMMAFFLLLWLLSSTSESQKEGIAEYFAPKVGVKDGLGIGVQGGQSPTKDGIMKTDLMPPGIIFGSPPTGMLPKEKTSDIKSDEGQEQKEFEHAEEEIRDAFENDAGLAALKEHVIIDMTPEGLRIQLVDQNKRPMFEPGSANLTDAAKTILGRIAVIIGRLPNNLSISGHTDSTVYPAGATYTNWELSIDRANATRKFLMTKDLKPGRFNRVQGKADREHLDPDNPGSPRNRRIALILLKKSISPYEVPAPAQLLKAPKPSDPKPELNLQPKTLKDR